MFRQDRLARGYGLFTVGFIIFTLILLALELTIDLSHNIIAWSFMALTMGLYAVIGIMSRTKVLDEYYVAGRSVPAIFNGMATGADWMSAASFISMAGSLWLLGYDGLAYIMGWTGGYVLLALLFAPYIRKFGQYTIPDFVGARYGGSAARTVAAIAAIIVSFTYVTAQVVGVGLIMSRFVGVSYEWGVVLGLAGVLFCSFLGGMKAVTWTQVAQYVILIVAYLVPVIFLSIKLTGVPIPQASYGEALQQVQRLEAEQQITKQYIEPYNEPMSNAASIGAIKGVNSYFGTNWNVPAAKSVTDWKGQPWDFLALTLCLMLGTAGLPHILIRFYTVPSVKESRMSVGYSLFFIFLLYFTAPAYAAFSRWELLSNVVGGSLTSVQDGDKTVYTIAGKDGQPLDWIVRFSKTGLLTLKDFNTLEGLDGTKLPAWAADQTKGDAPKLIWSDANGDGKVQLGAFQDTSQGDVKTGVAGELSGAAITAGAVDGKVQFAELDINADLIVLSTPELAGLPYTIAALIAAGGLAAALSTADGLLVVIASAIAHDVYYRIINPKASPATRMALGKGLVVVAAALSALAAMPRLALIAQMVAWAFSLAASSFFPIILLGIFWKRANGPGAIAGIIGGMAVCIFYMYNNYLDPSFNVLGITHLGSGVFGLIANFTLTYVVSKLTAEPSKEIQELVDHLRHPQEDDAMMDVLSGNARTAGAAAAAD
jgi:cation/acetate symporter